MVFWEEAGLYNVTGGCAAVPSLPPLTFTIDSVDYTLSPQQYILQVIGSRHKQHVGHIEGRRGPRFGAEPYRSLHENDFTLIVRSNKVCLPEMHQTLNHRAERPTPLQPVQDIWQ